MILYYILEMCSEGRFYVVFLLVMVIINKAGINFGFDVQIYVVGCDIPGTYLSPNSFA